MDLEGGLSVGWWYFFVGPRVPVCIGGGVDAQRGGKGRAPFSESPGLINKPRTERNLTQEFSKSVSRPPCVQTIKMGYHEDKTHGS